MHVDLYVVCVSGVEVKFFHSGITTTHLTLACLKTNSTAFVNLYFLSQSHKNVRAAALQSLRLKPGSINSQISFRSGPNGTG